MYYYPDYPISAMESTLVLEQQPINTPVPDCDNVYFIHCCETNFYKIGHSVTPNKRLATFQTGCPFELELLACCSGGSEFEEELHIKYKAQRTRGEWFSFSDDDVADLLEIFMKKRSSFLDESIDTESSDDSVTSLVDLLKEATLSPPTESKQLMFINKSNVNMFEAKMPDTNVSKTLKELYGDNEIEYLLGFVLFFNIDILCLNIKWCPNTKVINYNEIAKSYISSVYAEYTSKSFSSFFEVFKLLWVNCDDHNGIAQLVIAKCSHYKYSDPLFKLLTKARNTSREILNR